MANKLKVEVIVGLVDRLSKPLQQIQQKLRRAGAQLSMAGMGASLAGREILDPLRQAVTASGELSAALTEVGIVAEVPAARLAALRPELRALANETNQTLLSLAEGLKILTAKGIGFEDAVGSLGALGKTTTAANADLADMAETVAALRTNLGVLPADMQQALDMLTVAGNEGAFELKAMAKEFPSLTAAAAKLGVVGAEGVATLGAALQVAMKGAGTQGEAANNVLNLLTKLTSKTTVEAAAKYWGVDLPAAFAEWKRKGLNPVEESLSLIQAKTGGDAFKISEVFGDMQVIAALTPLLANLREYQRIKGAMQGGGGAVEAQFGRRMEEDPTQRWKSLGISLGGLADTVGTILLPPLERLVKTMQPMMDNFAAWSKENPRLAEGLTIAAAAIGALLVVLGPLLMGLGGLIAATGLFAGGLGLIAGAIGFLLSPLGLAIAAIAALVAGFMYFRDDIVLWVVDAVVAIEGLVGRFVAVGAAIVDGLKQGIQQKWDSLILWVSEKFTALAEKTKNILGIQSPSKVFAGIGSNIVRGLEVGIASRDRYAQAAVSDLFGGALAMAGGGRGASISMPITVQVTAPAGADAAGLAALVRREVAGATRSAAGRIAALYDGADGL